MMTTMRSWLAMVLAGVALCPARAEEPVARRMETAPAVDGALGEWAQFPKITLKHPDVPDLKVPRASMGWTDSALHLAVQVLDQTIVNKEGFDRLSAADCLDVSVASPDRKTAVRLLVAPSSAEGKPACRLVKQDVGTKASEVLFASTEPSALEGFAWSLQYDGKHWTVEASIPFALLGVAPKIGEPLPFVMVVFDRDKPDVDEWKLDSGWNKRAESSDKKKGADAWPVIVLADENARETLKVKSGVKIARKHPCNLFKPDEEVAFDYSLKGFPAGAGTLEAVVSDAFGREVLRKTVDVEVQKGDAAARVLELGRPGRGYYEMTVRVQTKGADGQGAESSEKVSFGVLEQVELSVAQFLEQDRRFGLKWWGGVSDKPECIDMMCKLGLQWTRAIVRESVQIVTNSTLISTVKIERFPKELFDEDRYGPLAEYEAKFGRGSWTLKSLPREAEYKAWLAEDLAKLPANQTVFEIWNEPWDKMSPEDFSTISTWIREVVSKARPGARLGPNLRGDMSDYGYDAKVVAAGGMAGMDIVCLHPYGASEDREFLRAYKKWIAEKTGRAIDIYITEYGSHSCPEGPAKRTELDQAGNVTRQSLSLYAEDAKALIPHWLGQSENNPTYHEDWFGYVRKNLQPKPVLIAHANAARMVDGGKYLGDLWYGPGIGAMAYRKDGENRLALFTRGEPLEAVVDTGVAEVAVTDLFGREKRMATDDGKIALTLDKHVTYVCGLSDAAVAAASPELRADRWPKPEKPVRNVRVARRMKMPTLDGNFEDWKGATELYIQNAKVNGDDASGFAYLGWDADHLYIGVNMRDNEMFNKQPRAKLYRDDSIELFVSTEVREENAGYGPRDHQFFMTPTSGEGIPIVAKLADREAGVLKDVADAKFFLGKTSQGWAAEIALPWSEFPEFKPGAGAQIALEIRVNDSDTSHERWKLDPLDAGYVLVENPTSWSVLKLEE